MLDGLLCVEVRGSGVYIAVIECFTIHSTPDILTRSSPWAAPKTEFLNWPNALTFVNHSECLLPFSLLSENDLEQVFQMFTLVISIGKR